MIRFFRFCFLTAIIAIAMVSCEKEDPKYTVSFNSKGGTPTPQEQTVKQGGKVEKPADPTRDTYSLAGWAKADNETSALWDFGADAVTEDITLFARWSLNMYAVTFDSNGGSVVPAQNIAHGGRSTKPADPTRSGYEFDGWFVGDTKWDFATAITAPITLKAKWTALHTVTFDSDGGSAVPTQTIRNGTLASIPADPTKTLASGLYLGTLTDNYNYTFDGWFFGETEWDFGTVITAPITLKARWSLPGNVTRIASVLSNDVGGAFTYVNANSNGGEEYTLLIGTNVTVAQQTLYAANAKLTIIGIGAERILSGNYTTSGNPMFTINGNNVTHLSLGQNITLNRGDGVNIQRGIMIMHEGSKITEAYFAVKVSGLNSVFKMRGGEISGNIYGVEVEYGATCEVSGSSIITGNNRSGYDWRDMFIRSNCTFRLSGNARIGKLLLDAENSSTRSTVTIDGSYNGTVTELCLRGNSSGQNTIVSWWTNVPVIVDGTASVINMFNNGLGNFVDAGIFTVLPISATHVLDANGVLVLK